LSCCISAVYHSQNIFVIKDKLRVLLHKRVHVYHKVLFCVNEKFARVDLFVSTHFGPTEP